MAKMLKKGNSSNDSEPESCLKILSPFVAPAVSTWFSSFNPMLQKICECRLVRACVCVCVCVCARESDGYALLCWTATRMHTQTRATVLQIFRMQLFRQALLSVVASTSTFLSAVLSTSTNATARQGHGRLTAFSRRRENLRKISLSLSLNSLFVLPLSLSCLLSLSLSLSLIFACTGSTSLSLSLKSRFKYTF